MNFRGIFIFTSTILLYVTVSQGTTTNSSFNTCYFNNPSSQCPLGEACAIAPPNNMRVRRRDSYQEQDKQPSTKTWFTLGEIRRKGKGGGRGGGGRGGGGRRSGSYGGRSSSRGVNRNSRRSGLRSSTGSSTSWRYGQSISKQAYGRTVIGVTSVFVGFGGWYWWNNSPSNYYRWRQSNMNVNNLVKNQGICINKKSLRTMTRQDCYNWCMSQKYNDRKCAQDCGLEERKKPFDWVKLFLTAILPVAIAIVCCACAGCGFFLYKHRQNIKLTTTETKMTSSAI